MKNKIVLFFDGYKFYIYISNVEKYQRIMFQAKENIIQDFIDGKESAFKEIYEKYVSTLRYFGNKFLPEERVIEDILQDTFVSLWENRKKFSNELAIKSFLYTGVKNRCLNNLRHEKLGRNM